MMKFIYTKNILRQRFFLLIFSGFSRIFLALYIVIAFKWAAMDLTKTRKKSTESNKKFLLFQ